MNIMPYIIFILLSNTVVALVTGEGLNAPTYDEPVEPQQGGFFAAVEILWGIIQLIFGYLLFIFNFAFYAFTASIPPMMKAVLISIDVTAILLWIIATLRGN